MQYNTLGFYIRKKRLLSKMSLNSFAIENNIEPAILSRIERTQQGIKLNTLIKIANGFNMSAGEFLTEFEKLADTLN